PEELARIILKAMSRERAERYQSAGEMREALIAGLDPALLARGPLRIPVAHGGVAGPSLPSPMVPSPALALPAALPAATAAREPSRGDQTRPITGETPSTAATPPARPEPTSDATTRPDPSIGATARARRRLPLPATGAIVLLLAVAIAALLRRSPGTSSDSD